jgi:hypothetical protein
MYFPELGADLVTALAGLDVNEFAHFWKSSHFETNKKHSLSIHCQKMKKLLNFYF